MSMFLLAASGTMSPNPKQPCLTRCAGALQHRLATLLRIPIATTIIELPEVGGGIIAWNTDKQPQHSHVDVYESAQRAVVFYGDAWELTSKARASEIASRWCDRSPPLQWIGELDGNFLAILVDRAARSLWIVCDRLGRRSCRFVCSQTGLWLASHDLPLIAAAPIDLQFDRTSLESMWHFGWSLGGRSLVRGIQTQQPFETIMWSQCGLRRTTRCCLDRSEPPRKRSVPRQIIVEMSADILKKAHRLRDRSPEITVALTAGIDSRATFAAIRNVFDCDDVLLKTLGKEQSLDVRIARRIAERLGYKHVVGAVEGVDISDYRDNSAIMAMFMNGDSSTKRALCKRFQPPNEGRLSVGGFGGEILRGYYYSKLKFRSARSFPREHGHELLKRKFKVRDTELVARLSEVTAPWWSFAENGYDVLDLFYVFERFGRWSIFGRMPHNRFSVSLFDSFKLIEGLFRLPAPVGRKCDLHRYLIRKYLPECYWTPINDQYLVPMTNNRAVTLINSVFQKGRRQVALIGKKLGILPSAQAEQRSHEDLRNAILAQELFDPIWESLTAADSPLCDLLGRARIEELLIAHRRGRRVHGNCIGLMLCANQFACCARELHAEMRRPPALIAA